MHAEFLCVLFNSYFIVVALSGVGEAEWDWGSEAVPTQKAPGGSFMTT